MRTLPAATPTPTLAQLHDGDRLQMILLVHEAALRTTRRGAPFLSARVGDRSGTCSAVLWDAPEGVLDDAERGAAVEVRARYETHSRYGPQIIIESLRPADPDEVCWEELLAGGPCERAALERELDELIESVTDPDLAWLLEQLLGAGTPTGMQYRIAPAAKYNHHAYRCGLLEHSLQVARSLAAVAEAHPRIDRDLAVCGALLHDIGKLEAYEADGPHTDLTDRGRLEGEIPLGYYLIRRQIEERPGFPPALAQGLLHIVLSHHGLLEHGSPVLPSTREALLVHAMDRLSGDLGSFDRLESEADGREAWSRHDHALGRSVLLRAA
jgi:3'-5' exoribonuclease